MNRSTSIFASFCGVASLSVAHAADVTITCTAASSSSQVVMPGVGSDYRARKPDGPRNFTITKDGLKTAWNAPCDFMRGNVSGESVEVSCEGPSYPPTTRFKKTISIDRQMGTFRESFESDDGSGGAGRVSSQGTCTKRESF